LFFCREDIQAFRNLYKLIVAQNRTSVCNEAKPIERTRSDGDIKLIERNPKVTKSNDEPKMSRSLRAQKAENNTEVSKNRVSKDAK